MQFMKAEAAADPSHPLRPAGACNHGSSRRVGGFSCDDFCMVMPTEIFHSLESGGRRASLGGPEACQRAMKTECFAVVRTEPGLMLTLVVLRAAPGQELALHCIRYACWSSQLEHAVLENCKNCISPRVSEAVAPA